MSKKSNERRKKARTREFTALAEHRREGKQLVPPLVRLGFNLSSWVNDRLPEMLWGVLLAGHLPRERALAVFRRAVDTLRAQRQNKDPLDVTLSTLARIDEAVANPFMEALAADEDARVALSGLLMFPSLPGRSRWIRAIGGEVPRVGWSAIARAVAVSLNHQSQEATDVRWARLVAQVLAGKLVFAEKMRERVKQVLMYPSLGEMKSVRPFIRAGEMSLQAVVHERGDPATSWPTEFWSECMASSPCEPLNGRPPAPARAGTTVTQVTRTREEVEQHLARTQTTTALDARHDGSFGLVLYALEVLSDLMRVGNAATVLGRSGLRTILEAFLTLAYLAKNDDPKLWTVYRQYGAAQAKLAFLKLDASGATLSSVSSDTLEALANEDLWQEYVSIDLGQWAGSDLRKMSEAAGEKATYDKHYSWTSGFVHANWAAVRNAVFTTCINPLHRLHRIPRRDAATLEDVVPDAVELCDGMLGLLAVLYPPFTPRLTLAEPGTVRA